MPGHELFLLCVKVSSGRPGAGALSRALVPCGLADSELPHLSGFADPLQPPCPQIHPVQLFSFGSHWEHPGSLHVIYSTFRPSDSSLSPPLPQSPLGPTETSLGLLQPCQPPYLCKGRPTTHPPQRRRPSAVQQLSAGGSGGSLGAGWTAEDREGALPWEREALEMPCAVEGESLVGAVLSGPGLSGGSM